MRFLNQTKAGFLVTPISNKRIQKIRKAEEEAREKHLEEDDLTVSEQ